MAALTVPAGEEQRLKGLGFINNKNTDNFSARVVTRGGRLTVEQLEVLSLAARRFGDGCVSLTTRLSAEVTGIPYEKIEAFRAFLSANGMETGGTGSLVRPVVCCKGTTCRYGLLDTYALAEKIHLRFYEGYHHVKLPHKFKIAVGGCPNSCVKPELNDIGIVGWRGGCRVYVGGRWGKKHAVGTPLDRTFTEEEALEVIERAIRLFITEGKPGERFGDTVERIGFDRAQAALLPPADVQGL